MFASGILAVCVRCSAQTPDQPKAGAETGPRTESATAQKDARGPVLQPKPAVDETFVIGAEDVLAVNVWKEADISRTVIVRPDGKISLPLVGELQASTKTPRQLQEEISAKLSGFIAEPAVTVMVQEAHSHRFNILGKVEHPGSYPITESTTILDGIAIAGGFRDFAKQKSVYVLRRGPEGTQVRLPFNYKEVIRGQHLAQNIKLEPHDTIVVP